MPIARVQFPDGRVGRFEVAEGTSPEQVTSFAQQYYNQNLRSQEPQAAQPQATQTQTQPQTTQQPQATQTQPQARQAQLQQFRDETTREVGLGARAVLEGAAFLPSIVPDLAALGINAAFDTDIPLLSDIVSEGLSAIGLPEPETGVERVVSDVAGGAIGGAGIAKGIQALGSKVPKIIQQLAGKPALEAVVGGASAGATGVSREMGGSPFQQLGVGLIGGISAGSGVSRVLRARARVKGKPAELLADIGQRGIDEPMAFVEVREALQKESNRLRKKLNPLFEQAKEKGKNAFISSEQIKQLSNNFKKLAIDEIDRDGKDILTNASKRLDELAVNKIRVNDLEGLRRSASQTSRSGGTKGYIGHQIFTDIDEFLENAVIEGDQSAISVWKKAIKARREFGQKFETPKKIAKAVDSDQTLETIEKLFLGSSAVTSKAEIAKTYDEVLRALQPNKRKEAGFKLRQAVINRMIRTAAQRSDSKEGLSASMLSNSINNLRRDNRTLWNKFTVKERGELTKLETELTGLSDVTAVTKTAAWILSRTPSGALPGVVKPLTELPRTIRLKNIVTVKDLLKLSSSSITPKAKLPLTSSSVATLGTVQEEQ